MANNPVTKAEVKRWREDYRRGISVEQIANYHGRCEKTVYEHLLDSDIKKKRPVRGIGEFPHDPNARINPAIALMGCVDGFQWSEA